MHISNKTITFAQNIQANSIMAYILQTIEIKNASQKLVDFVKKLGVEKHSRMEERIQLHNSGKINDVEVIHL